MKSILTTLLLNIPLEMKEGLREASEASGESMAAIIRRAVQKELTGHENAAQAPQETK